MKLALSSGIEGVPRNLMAELEYRRPIKGKSHRHHYAAESGMIVNRR